MGRVRGKAKRSSIITSNDDVSGEEEKQPVKRRGRPTKAQKEEEAQKMNEKKDSKHQPQSDNGNKRESPSLDTQESPETVEDVKGVGPDANGVELTKAVGFRHNRSRRKNKPQRAAEVGVSACEVCNWLVLRG